MQRGLSWKKTNPLELGFQSLSKKTLVDGILPSMPVDDSQDHRQKLAVPGF